MTLLEALLASDQAVIRTRVLVGEDDDIDRRDGKDVIAQSECSYYCPDAATAERCIASLRDSDERLRSRPDELMLWDWKSSYWEPELNNPNGGGTVLLGVAWYDLDFFNDRRDAWFGAMHKRIYQDLGIPLENITVTHWVPAAA